MHVKHPRCPYCHDDIKSAHDKVACHSCMAWHHAGCWHGCGACRSTSLLRLSDGIEGVEDGSDCPAPAGPFYGLNAFSRDVRALRLFQFGCVAPACLGALVLGWLILLGTPPQEAAPAPAKEGAHAGGRPVGVPDESLPAEPVATTPLASGVLPPAETEFARDPLASSERGNPSSEALGDGVSGVEPSSTRALEGDEPELTASPGSGSPAHEGAAHEGPARQEPLNRAASPRPGEVEPRGPEEWRPERRDDRTRHGPREWR